MFESDEYLENTYNFSVINPHILYEFFLIILKNLINICIALRVIFMCYYYLAQKNTYYSLNIVL